MESTRTDVEAAEDLIGPPAEGEEDLSPVPDDAPLAAPTEPATPRWVYALGRIEPRIPTLAVEKEIAQVAGRTDVDVATDRELLQTVISDRANRYLARQLCWVLLVEGLETYVLAPRDPSDLELLIDAVRADPRRDDLDVVIGERGPIAPPEACNGLSVPMVVFDQIYSFERDDLISAIPRPDSIDEDRDDEFRRAAGELFDRVMQLADNAGATDDHRALNYLAVRHDRIYGLVAEAHGRKASLTAVDVRPSRLTGVRRVVDVVFALTHRETDVTEKYFVRVDVTEEFPFLVTRLAPFYER